MNRALILLARCVHQRGLPPEAGVVAFKNAIYCFGGVRTFPMLAADHNPDGEGCGAAYALSFTGFIRAYFSLRGDSE